VLIKTTQEQWKEFQKSNNSKRLYEDKITLQFKDGILKVTEGIDLDFMEEVWKPFLIDFHANR
tara:strand:+ start:281 stop:469 length:189 start_codon:yes stop_codon:yes gene_type:complete